MSRKQSDAALVGVAVVGVVLGGAALIAVSCVWAGFVLSIMWGWFIAPLGVPAISIPTAIGLSLVASMLTGRGAGKDEREASQAWAAIFLRPAFVLLLGWVATLFL